MSLYMFYFLNFYIFFYMSYFIDMHISIYMSILRRNEFLVSFDISQSWADLQNDLLKLIVSEKELHTNREIAVKGLLRNSGAFSDCPTNKCQIN